MNLPLLAEPADLAAVLMRPDILLVDVSSAEDFAAGHIAGAVNLPYSEYVTAQPPVMGLVPDAAQLSAVFSKIGLTAERHVVAYDNEGNGKASRLLYTLDCVGHGQFSLLNGGLGSWLAAGETVTTEVTTVIASDYVATLNRAVIADQAEILSRLDDTNTVLLDNRSAGEYAGEMVKAARGGHIPGAVHFEWTAAMDHDHHRRIRPLADLRAELAALNVTAEKAVITYCQTHHRSAHTYIVLKALGFKQLQGYPGAWSDWGNADNTPIETIDKTT